MSEFVAESGGGEESGGMGDYFSQVELINDDGSPIDSGENNPIGEDSESIATAPTVSNEQPVPAVPAAPAPLNPVLKTGLFNDAGEFDLTKATEFFKKTGSFKYEKSAPAPVAAPVAPASVVPAPVVAPKTWRDEFSAYESNIRQNLLGPLEALWNENIAAGIPQNDPMMLNLQNRYAEQNRTVDAHLQSKRAEYEDKHIESVLSGEKSRLSEIESATKAQAVQTMLEQEAGGREAYQTLMFGAADQSGNFVEGPGAEIINYLYDLQNGTKEATPESYQKWWRDFSANESNARTVFKMASALHLQNNFDMVLSSARNEWDRSAQERRQGAMRSPGGASNPISAGGGGGNQIDPAVARFAGVNQQIL